MVLAGLDLSEAARLMISSTASLGERPWGARLDEEGFDIFGLKGVLFLMVFRFVLTLVLRGHAFRASENP